MNMLDALIIKLSERHVKIIELHHLVILIHDFEDFEKNNKIKCPIFVLWGNRSDTGKVWGDVLNVWQNYSDQKVQGEGLDCGHYLQEEQPKKVLEWFKKFL